MSTVIEKILKTITWGNSNSKDGDSTGFCLQLRKL